MISRTKIFALGQLIRFDKPIGTLLLLWPTLCALWIASRGRPHWRGHAQRSYRVLSGTPGDGFLPGTANQHVNPFTFCGGGSAGIRLPFYEALYPLATVGAGPGLFLGHTHGVCGAE